MLYEYTGDEPLPLPFRLRVRFHSFFCPQCAQEIERFELSRDILRSDFFPSAPNFEETVMSRIREEDGMAFTREAEAGISFLGWIITGLVLLFSLVSVFFGTGFGRIVRFEGNSFLLPVGITIGAVLTCYGAIFIGSHLDELTERFGQRFGLR
jgi:hypothetical protein